MGDDDARRILLARRARFIAAALAGVTATGMAVVAGVEAGCGGETTAVPDGGDGPKEPRPTPCLSLDAGQPTDGATPQPCLTPEPEPPRDAGVDTSVDANNPKDASRFDVFPFPCLTPPIDGGF